MAENISRLQAKKEELNSELIICEKVHKFLEEKVAIFERMQAIVESNTRKSNVELPGIPVFDICKDYEIEVPPMKFEPGH